VSKQLGISRVMLSSMELVNCGYEGNCKTVLLLVSGASTLVQRRDITSAPLVSKLIIAPFRNWGALGSNIARKLCSFASVPVAQCRVANNRIVGNLSSKFMLLATCPSSTVSCS
jgi:hypothetical protein